MAEPERHGFSNAGQAEGSRAAAQTQPGGSNTVASSSSCQTTIDASNSSAAVAGPLHASQAAARLPSADGDGKLTKTSAAAPTTAAIQTSSSSSLESKRPPNAASSTASDPLKVSYSTTSNSPSNPTTCRTPPLFQYRKLRAGKWIPEEEDYAEHLITLFEKGRVSDCENGMTLRSYLSQKLHCAPMRISKKYAGKGIGKMIYLSKLHVNAVGPSIEETFQERRKLQTLENAFYKAVFPDASLAPAKVNVYPTQPTSAVTTVPMVPGLVPLIGPSAFPNVNGNAINPTLATQIPMAFAPNAAAAPTVPFAAPAPNSVHTAQPPPMVAGQTFPLVSNSVDPAIQLQISFLNALNATQAAAQATPAAVATIPTLPTIAAVQAPQPAAAPQVQAPPPQPVPAKPPAPQQQQPLPNTTLATPSLITQVEDPVKQTKKMVELHDFLAGFDKVTGTLQNPNVNPAKTETPVEHSPPFTSKSFDEFHRLLGKDVDEIGRPTNNANVQAPVQSTVSIHPRPPPHEANIAAAPTAGATECLAPDTMELFSADSYAMFAQDSVLAMSHQTTYGIPQPGAEEGVPGQPGSENASIQTSGSALGNPALFLSAPAPGPTTADSLLESTYGQVVGNPFTQIAPDMDNLKDSVPQGNVVSGSERASSSDPFSNNEYSSSKGTSGSSASDNNEDSEETGSSSSDGPCHHHQEAGSEQPARKKQRLECGDVVTTDGATTTTNGDIYR